MVGALPRLVVVAVTEAPILSPLCALLFDEAGAECEGRQASLNRLCELSVIALLRVCIERRWVGAGTLAGLTDPRLAKAVVDRLTHKAHIIDTGTESWRFRHGLAQRTTKRG